MIRIREFKKAKNNFPLKERSVSSIKMFDTQKEFYPGDDPDEILEHFELLYELEYKYHAIRNNNFLSMERRRDNILDIIEEKSKIVIEALAGTFEIVFADWLDKHAITNPEEWARQRLYDDGYDSMAEIMGFEKAMGIMMDELERYVSIEKDELVTDVIAQNPDVIEESFLDDWVSDQLTIYLDELKNEDLEEFNNMYEHFFERRFDNEDEAREFLEKYFYQFDNDYFEFFGSRKKALKYIISEMDDIGFFDNTENIENFINVDEFFMTAYKEIVFPVWYDYWSGMGIDETRKNVEDVYEQLTSIEKQPLRKQFMILNIAKNTNHQNGSMMEYYEEMWGVDYVALEKLSNMDIREWNDELEEIGVDL